MPKTQHPNMVLRRLLLDGVKIIEPYRRALVHDPGPGTDAEAVANEVKLMETWVKMARVVALKLKKGTQGKKSESDK